LKVAQRVPNFQSRWRGGNWNHGQEVVARTVVGVQLCVLRRLVQSQQNASLLLHDLHEDCPHGRVTQREQAEQDEQDH
jgi:hypothetical protein